ncbi:MAG TPA: methyltransferase domain-containing protein [Anaerolineae bacterium]|nr:methyltransferase domain-containing protein [Anaerolineae bacterium]
MKNVFRVVLLLAATIVGFGLGVRLLSRRRFIPCPWWLDWLLENRYMEAVASGRVLVERAGLASGMAVLDAGCGPGRMTIPAARRVGPGGEVLAVDFQAEQLQRAQAKAVAAHVANVRFLQAGLGDGKLPEAAFERALLCTVLGEILDREAALVEIFRALKPGGLLSVTEVLPDPHFQGMGTLRALARGAGFVDGQVIGGRLAYTMNFAKPDRSASHEASGADLAGLQSTLLYPLYWRAVETQRSDAMICDHRAVELTQQIDFDFSRFDRVTSSQQVFTMMRTRQMDRWVRSFLTAHPGAVVVDIGCGLDARFERVDDGRVIWFDLDLSAVIALRRQFYAETARRRFIASSAFDLAWLDQIPIEPGQPCLFVSEGVLLYFPEYEVRRLVLALRERFPESELIFDSAPWILTRAGWLHPALRALKQNVSWCMRAGDDLEAWHPAIRLLEDWHYFDQPEPRLGLARLGRFIPTFRTGYRVVRYRLGEARDVQD